MHLYLSETIFKSVAVKSKMFLLLFSCVNLVLATCTPRDVWYQNGLVPEVIKKAPAQTIWVSYGENKTVNYGNELTPGQTQDQPEVSWKAKEDDLYTFVLTDPLYIIDLQNYEYLHWLVGNIPGKKLNKGDILKIYQGPAPPAGSGLHTYTFLVFKQKKRIDFEIPANREGFFIQEFADQYDLGDAVFGNFFKAQDQGS